MDSLELLVQEARALANEFLQLDREWVGADQRLGLSSEMAKIVGQLDLMKAAYLAQGGDAARWPAI